MITATRNKTSGLEADYNLGYNSCRERSVSLL
jgi:hypothetical protein